MIEYEDFIHDVGKLGRYQVLLFIVLGCFSLRTAFNVLSFLFLVDRHTEYDCDWLPLLNGTDFDKYNCTNTPSGLQCNFGNKCELNVTGVIVPCTKWIYRSASYSLFEKFDMVCGRAYIPDVLQAGFWIGMILGVFFGPIADKYGRRPTLLVCCALDTLSAFVLIFAPNPWFYMCGRIMAGLAAGGLKIPLILFEEIIYKKYRALTGNMWWLKWVLGYILCPFAAYYLRDWQQLQIFGFCLCFLYIPFIWILPESPRWLLIRGRREEAEKTLSMIAKWNGVSMGNFEEVEVKIEKHLGRITDLFRTPKIRNMTFNLSFSWFVSSLLYYGYSLNSRLALEDVYLSVFLMGLSEIPAYFLGFICSEKLGRRFSVSSLYIFCAVFLIGLPFLPDIPVLRAVIAILGKTVSAGVFGLLIVYTTEVYPTGLRNSGTNWGNTIARISGAIAPVISNLTTVAYWLPFLIFASVAVVSGALVQLLPETKDQPLPQTIQEAEMRERHNYKFWEKKQTVFEIEPLNEPESTEKMENNGV